MPEPPVVNASPLIVLSRAGRLDLLQLVADRIVVPAAVAEEVTAHSDEAARAIGEHAWLERVPAIPVSAAVAAWDLGAGESAVLSWAAAHPGAVAVVDDYAARTCARSWAFRSSERSGSPCARSSVAGYPWRARSSRSCGGPGSISPTR